MKNLTPHQQQLVDEMVAEFSRINPKPSVDGKKRFSIASIDECNQEKNRVLQTMAAHNRAFLENAITRMQEQFQEFDREFKSVVSFYVKDYLKKSLSFEEHEEIIKAILKDFEKNLK